jgi:hypothetical protein
MLGGLQEIGSAVAAAAGGRGPEGAVAAVAVLEGRPQVYGCPGCRGRGEWGWEQFGEAVGQEAGRVAEGGLGEARRQGAAYGFGGGAAVQPGGDGGGEAAYVALREQQAGVVAVQAREEGGGCVVGG